VDGTPFGFSTDEPTATSVGGKQYFALHMWNIETGERLYTIDDFSSAVDVVLIHPGGSLYVTNNWSDECFVWELVSGKRVRSLSAESVRAVISFSPDGERYLTREGVQVNVHEWASSARVSRFAGHQQMIQCSCWSPDGKLVATGDSQGVIGLWDVATGDRQKWLLDNTGTINASAITALRFTGDGKGLIAATGNEASLAVWSLRDWRVCAVVYGHQSPITDIQVSTDGLTFSSVTREALRVWTLEDSPHLSARTVSLAHSSTAGLPLERFKMPKIEGMPLLDSAPGIRIFGPLEGRAAVVSLLVRGLGDAEKFTEEERRIDRQVREAPSNPFQALRDLPFQP
jgi:WD40 repeat protein